MTKINPMKMRIQKKAINIKYNPILELTDFYATYKREADSAYIRRSIKLLCLRIGFSSNSIDSVLLMLTELLTNVSKHAKGIAEISATVLKQDYRYSGIKVVVRDYGPGIDNISEALLDGYSSAGSLGLGLGAVKRLSDEFIINSNPHTKYNFDTGTVVEFIKYLKSKPVNMLSMDNLPQYHNKSTYFNSAKWFLDGNSEKKDGSRYNGDAIYWSNDTNEIIGAVIDGIGHGYPAYIASKLALEAIKNNKNKTVSQILKIMHKDLAESVGCQILLLKIDKNSKLLTYIIIGNIRAFVLEGSSFKSLLSKDGTIGRMLPSLSEQVINVSQPISLIAHTDGISRVWISELRSNNQMKIQVFNNEYFRNYRKRNDDSSWLCLRNY